MSDCLFHQIAAFLIDSQVTGFFRLLRDAHVVIHAVTETGHYVPAARRAVSLLEPVVQEGRFADGGAHPPFILDGMLIDPVDHACDHGCPEQAAAGVSLPADTAGHGCCGTGNSIIAKLQDILQRHDCTLCATAAQPHVFPGFRPACGNGLKIESWLKEQIPGDRILMETKSRNTWENAFFSRELIQENAEDRQVLLITSAYHMRRSLSCFRKAGINVIPYAVDYRQINKRGVFKWFPDEEALSNSYLVCKEFLGLVVYKIRGYN